MSPSSNMGSPSTMDLQVTQYLARHFSIILGETIHTPLPLHTPPPLISRSSLLPISPLPRPLTAISSAFLPKLWIKLHGTGGSSLPDPPGSLIRQLSTLPPSLPLHNDPSYPTHVIVLSSILKCVCSLSSHLPSLAVCDDWRYIIHHSVRSLAMTSSPKTPPLPFAFPFADSDRLSFIQSALECILSSLLAHIQGPHPITLHLNSIVPILLQVCSDLMGVMCNFYQFLSSLSNFLTIFLLSTDCSEGNKCGSRVDSLSWTGVAVFDGVAPSPALS
jgi:hypothetical protein